MNLEKLLAAMLREGWNIDPQPDAIAELLATPEGKALADVIAAAEAWRDTWPPDDELAEFQYEDEKLLHAAIDHLRALVDNDV